MLILWISCTSVAILHTENNGVCFQFKSKCKLFQSQIISFGRVSVLIVVHLKLIIFFHYFHSKLLQIIVLL